jgi:nucleotide-binding universal stress UspA family protein
MRSILVTVDDTPASMAARSLAVAMARQTGAAIHGITGIEVSDLDQIEPVPLGGASHAYDRLRHRQQQMKRRQERIVELSMTFKRALAEQGLEAPCLVVEADVRGELRRQIESCDLVVTGRDTEFHLESRRGLTPLVEYIIAGGCRPVVVSGSTDAGKGPVIVAYDGSVPAAKALQMATLLGTFGPAGLGKRAHIVSVGDSSAAALAAARRAGAFLKSYGVDSDLDSIVSSSDPSDHLLKRAAETDAYMLVMGAFGHRGMREVLFGSCTRRLFNSALLPLFIYH